MDICALRIGFCHAVSPPVQASFYSSLVVRSRAGAPQSATGPQDVLPWLYYYGQRLLQVPQSELEQLMGLSPRPLVKVGEPAVNPLKPRQGNADIEAGMSGPWTSDARAPAYGRRVQPPLACHVVPTIQYRAGLLFNGKVVRRRVTLGGRGVESNRSAKKKPWQTAGERGIEARNFSQFFAIFRQRLFACPPCVLVGALCVPCAEVLLFEASGGLVPALQFFRDISAISHNFPAIFLARHEPRIRTPAQRTNAGIGEGRSGLWAHSARTIHA